MFQTYSSDLSTQTPLVTSEPLIEVADVTSADIPVALAYMTRTTDNLCPRDAFHLAIMKRLGIDGIVSNDGDFSAHSIATIDHRR